MRCAGRFAPEVRWMPRCLGRMDRGISTVAAPNMQDMRLRQICPGFRAGIRASRAVWASGAVIQLDRCGLARSLRWVGQVGAGWRGLAWVGQVMRMPSIVSSRRNGSMVRILARTTSVFPGSRHVPVQAFSSAELAERHAAVPIDRGWANGAVDRHRFLESRLNVHVIHPPLSSDCPRTTLAKDCVGSHKTCPSSD